MNRSRNNCPHREDKPRRCASRGCRTWLTSANPDRYCWSCGGWSSLRLRSLEAFQHFKPNSFSDREAVGAALEEILA